MTIEEKLKSVGQKNREKQIILEEKKSEPVAATVSTPSSVPENRKPKTESKKGKGGFTYFFLDCFRPKKFDVERVPRTLHMRKDNVELEARIFSIVGGSGKSHRIHCDSQGKEVPFKVSASAFYNFLLEDFWENNKVELIQLEKLQQTGQLKFN